MSFDVFVSGRGRKGGKHYHLSKKGFPDGDEWDLGPVKSQILKRLGVGAPPSPTGNAMAKALKAYGSIEMLNFFFLGVCDLLMRSPGKLSIRVKHEHLVWPTTGKFRVFRLDASASERKTTGTIVKFLHENDMNRWGVLLTLAGAFAEFTAGPYKVKSGFYLNVTLSD